VQAYREHLLETLALSPATINRRLQSLRKFGRFALQSGMINIDPALGVTLLRRPVGAGPRTLSPAEIERLDQAAARSRSRTALRDRAIVQLLLQTGIRVGELVELRLTDLELDDIQGSLTVRPLMGRPGRRASFDRLARDVLSAYLTQDRLGDTEFLFQSREGKSLSVRTVQQVLARLSEDAGLILSAKTLRDTHARMLWQETGDLGYVAERLGYRRPEAAVKHITPLRLLGSQSQTEDLRGRSSPLGSE
jgi:integrase/recombinase XerC